jgi:RNA polymerase sigma-70 factor (ECF subfamily)
MQPAAAALVLDVQCATRHGVSQPAMTNVLASPSALTPTAADLLDAAGRGDHAAWDRIFTRHYRLVLRYSVARLGDAHAAEDVAQEVFVAAVASVRRLRDRSDAGIEAWLLGIARNKCRERARADHRRTAQPDERVAGDAADVAVTRIAAAEVRAAMNHLSDDQREVVIRRFLLDQSLDEVAAATGRPVGAVKSMQHRAIAALTRLCEGMA